MLNSAYQKISLAILSLFSVYAFANDIPEISALEVTKLDTTQHIIIDVRTKEEYQAGHVPGAINLPLSEIQNAKGNLSLDKNKTLVLYCRSGYRAGKAANALKDLHYSNLKHLDGDMLGWKKAGLPIEK